MIQQSNLENLFYYTVMTLYSVQKWQVYVYIHLAHECIVLALNQPLNHFQYENMYTT